MRPQSNAIKRLNDLYRRLVRRMRAYDRLARWNFLTHVPMRLHIEALQPRLMMSGSPTVTSSGTETLANTATSDIAQTPAVAMNAAGDSVIVWASDAAGGAVYGQLFNAGGTKIGTQFQINQTGVGDSPAPAVAMDAEGDFAVSWNDAGSSVFSRLYNATGTAVTGQTLIANIKTGASRTAIAMAPTGGVYRRSRRGYRRRFAMEFMPRNSRLRAWWPAAPCLSIPPPGAIKPTRP